MSNERQLLWRMAHRDKFSVSWWKRHDRIAAIGKQLAWLWHMHRVEVAAVADRQQTAEDRIAGDHFEDYREHVGEYHVSEWRIEDEAYHERRYMSVAEGLRDNQYHYLKKPTNRPSAKPNVGARQRNKLQASVSAVL